MKKNKGFTLIELLAIIVILAIIAVITVPIILNIIDNAKKGSVQDSAYGYKDAINKFYVSKLAQDKDYIMPNKTYTTEELKNLGVSLSGQEPIGNSWVTLENNNVTNGCLQFDEYKVDIENGKVTNTEKGECEEYSSIPGMTIDGVKYYDTVWIKENPVQYNPGRVASGNMEAVPAGKCTDGDDCKTWYPYSEFTQNGQKYVNMILDRNTTISVAWASSDDYMGTGDNPVSPAQNSTENTVGISYPQGKTSFTEYGSGINRCKNEKGPLTVLNQLHLDTDLWNLPLRTDSYTPWDNDFSAYTIDYSGYKARLISAEEISFITRKNTVENPDSWNLSSSSLYLGTQELGPGRPLNSEQLIEQQRYSWLFNYTNSGCTSYGCLIADPISPSTYGYWTSSPTFEYGAFGVTYQGKLGTNGVDYTSRGIRPVITVPKSVLGIN